MANITYTIGAGRDYTTWAAFNTQLGTIDAPFNDDVTGELYDALLNTTATTEAYSFNRPDYGVGTGSLVIKPGSGARHSGYWTTGKAGFSFEKDDTSGPTFLQNLLYPTSGTDLDVIYRALQMRRVSSSASSGSQRVTLVRSSGSGTGSGTIRFTECVFVQDIAGTGNALHTVFCDNGMVGMNLIFDNCLFISNNRAACLRVSVTLASLRVYNCVFLSRSSADTPYGLHVSSAPSGTYEVKNCYSATTTSYASFRPFDLTGSPTVTNCASGGGNASYQATSFGGSGNYNTVPAADYFDLTDIASGIVFRKTYSGGGSNRLDDTGADLGSDYAADVTGAVRSGTWSIGCEEFVNNQPPVLAPLTIERSDGAGGWVSVAKPVTCLTGTLLRFHGTATDAEDGVLTQDIEWEADTGSGFASIGTGEFVEWTAPGSAGTFSIRATIEDSGTATDTETFTVTTQTIVADAGPDQVKAGLDPQITLNGSGSAVATGTIAYSWVQTAGTSVTLSATNVASPTFSAPLVTSGTESLVFELTVTNGLGGSDTDTVTVTVAYCRQQALYMMRRAAQRLYDLRTAWRTTDGYTLALWAQTRNTPDWTPPVTPYPADHVAAGYPSGASAALGAWTLEDGAISYTPNACMCINGGTSGAPAVLAAMAECYRATGSTFFRDKALEFASSICYVLGQLQFWQDCAVFKVGSFNSDGSSTTGVVLPNTNEAGVLRGASRKTPTDFLTIGTTNISYWDSWCNDEGALGCALSALLQMHRALRERGDSIPTWLLDGHSDLPHANGIKGVLQTYITLADTDFGDGVLGVRKPYATGGIPEVYPIAKAFAIDANGNQGNLWGSYMQDKMVQDKAHASMMVALGLAVSEFTATGDSMLSDVQAFFDLQVDWTLDRMVAYAADDVYGICGQYGIGPTIYEPDAYYGLDEPSFARPQDIRGVLISETDIVPVLVWLYRQDYTLAADKLRIADFTSSPPVGALPFYLDKMRGTDTARANDATIPAFPVKANGEWYRAYVYPDDEHLAAATTALGATPEIVFCISSGVSTSTIRKIGYDTVEGVTPPDTSDPDFNIGFVRGGLNGAGVAASPNTAEGGQLFYFGGGACDATPRIQLCDAGTLEAPAGTGYLLESRMGTYGNFRDDAFTFYTVNTWNSSVAQAVAAYEDAYAGWRSGTTYSCTIFSIRLAKIALGYSSMPNVPAVYDSDGDGTPDGPTLSVVEVRRSISGTYTLQNPPYEGDVSTLWRFSATASDGAGGDLTSSIVWEYNNGSAWIAIGTASTVDWTAPATPGGFTFRARVTVGGQEDSETFTISTAKSSSTVSAGAINRARRHKLDNILPSIDGQRGRGGETL